jgi:DNA gyrase/topoisomerase IV subunit B
MNDKYDKIARVRELHQSFFGDDDRAPSECVEDLLAHAVASCLAGATTRIDVVVDGHTIALSYDGPPLPFDDGSLSQRELFTSSFIEHGGPFGPTIYMFASGRMATVCAVCDELVVDSGGERRSYARGKLLSTAPSAERTNEIRASLDPTLVEHPSHERTRHRVARMADLLPDCTLSFNGERLTPRSPLDLLHTVAEAPMVVPPCRTVVVVDGVLVDLSFGFQRSAAQVTRGFVGMDTSTAGRHFDAFWSSAQAAVERATGAPLELDGLVAVVCVAMNAPKFRDFERSHLVSIDVGRPVEHATALAMDAHLLQYPSLVRYLQQHNRRRSPA